MNRIDLQTIIKLYKNNKVSRYAMEKEIASFLGDKSHVIISDQNIRQTYGIMVFPERCTDGFHITYIVDNNYLMDICPEDKFVSILNELIFLRSKILAKFNNFENERKGIETPLNVVIGFILDLYTLYNGKLNITGKEQLIVSSDDILKIADKFNMENNEEGDKELLILKGFMPKEGFEFCKKYTTKFNGFSITLVNSETEIPEKDIWYTLTQKLATSTFGARDHKEIPYDYTPNTNQ